MIFLATLLLLGGCELLSFNGGSADEPWPDIREADDSTLPETLRRAYQHDAAQLAFRLAQPSDAVELPQDLVGSIYAALVHVYNARAVPARDQVVGLHAFPHRSTERLLVRLDTTVAWTRAWRVGNRLTGEAAIDALVEAYDLQVEYRAWSSGHTAILTAPRPLNTIALGARFAAHPGVRLAEPDGGFGGVADIAIDVERGAWLLDYSLGSGDCPAGCIHRTYWTFRVAESGVVTYLGSRSK